MNILVTGATGTVGRHLVNQLFGMGHHVRALTRNPANANFPDGVEVIAGDLTNPATFADALEGVEALHMINFGGDNYAPLETGAEIIAMAEAAGVKRVTVLRGGPEGQVEQAVKASSMAWTFLEPVEFMSNIYNWSHSIRATRAVRQPFGDRKTAIVHEADIAAVAAGALTSDGHAGKSYSITGPEILTPRAIVRIISETLKEGVQFIELTPDEARQEWTTAGYPAQVVDFLIYVYGNTPAQGYTVTSTVEDVTGRPARSFVQWAAENVHMFAANEVVPAVA